MSAIAAAQMIVKVSWDAKDFPYHTYDSDADAAAYGGDKLRAQGATVPADPYSLDKLPPL